MIRCCRTVGVTDYLFESYAEFALLNDGIVIHTLAIQMGTSIAMIEPHYSHLTPRPRKEVLTGRRYELSQDEFEGLTWN